MLELLSLRVRAGGRTLLYLLRHDTLSAVLVLLVFVVGAVLLVGAVQAEGAARQLATASVGLLWLIHLSRRDARFLMLAGHVPALFFAVEYLALLLPVAALLATGAARWLAPAVLLGGVLIAWMPSGPLAHMHARLLDRRSTFSPVPALDFEWISGLRELLLPLGLLYLVAIPFSAMPVGIIALAVLLTWGACYFYLEGEGWLLIQAFGLPPGAFLRVKIGRALRLWVLLMAPLAILFLVRHLSLWPVLLLALVGCAAVLAGSVLMKYVVYYEGRRGGTLDALLPLLLTGIVLVPPVAAFFYYRLWRAASRNLDPYLHAFD